MSLVILISFSCEKNKGTITAPINSDPDTSVVRVDKPNIYIYPTQKIELDVYLSFPMGGSVVQSIPQYNNGWSVTVDTSGLINNQYHYLFYECRVPNYFQKEKGWIVEEENLEIFFRENLAQTGFINNEIDDFIEYWIPRLNYSSEYILYPQYSNDISPLIELTLSEQPNSLLRYFYLIEENSKGISTIEKPAIPEFNRTGFTVAEWGVIIYY
jgi:hypothetical protein